MAATPTFSLNDAAESVRDAIHTGAHHSAYEFPSQVYDTYGVLTLLADRLAQAINQSAGWVTRETSRSRIAVVSGAHADDPPAAAAAMEHHSSRAAAAIGDAAEQLRAAHNIAAATATPSGLPTPRGIPTAPPNGGGSFFREGTDTYVSISPMAEESDPVTPALVTALDQTWRAIRSHYREVPEVVLTLDSGTEAGPPRNGHYAPGCWQRGPDQLPELFISGEELKRGPRGVLSTVLHEAAHGVADTRGIHDTSRQGRWHNTRFRALAEELGLTVEKTDNTGWSATTVPDSTASTYANELQALETAITAYRRTQIRPQSGGRGSNNGHAAVCGCGRRIRASTTVLDQGPILCGLCMQHFQP